MLRRRGSFMDSFTMKSFRVQPMYEGERPGKTSHKDGSEFKSYTDKRDKSVNFIKDNFTRKECMRFVPVKDLKRKPTDLIKCHCGEVMERHNKKAIIKDTYKSIVYSKVFPEDVEIEEWNQEKCVQELPTNAFGILEFLNEGLGGRKPSKYLRLSDNTDVNTVIELMGHHWNMLEPKQPNLVITVIGGAKNFKLDGKKKVIFNRGLVNAAQTTHAWIITSGCNMGVMKAVGEAVREGQTYIWDEASETMTHSIRCIGIAPWGYVDNRQHLVNEESARPSLYKASNIIKHSHPVSLNPDHTHFFLVDDGRRLRYDGVAEFRAKLERKLMLSSTIPDKHGDTGLDIPVILVVVEGGFDAIRDVRKSLSEKIPVVICEGTGRAADIIAYAQYITARKGDNEYSEQQKFNLRSKLRAAFGKTWQRNGDVEKKVQEFFDMVIECCKDENLITVFDMNKDEDLDRAILSALLKGQGASHQGSISSREHQLRLALTWNRSDVADEKILTENIVWDIEFLHEIMTTALLDNKVDFVRLLLKNGVVMREYLTIERLRHLYNKSPRSHVKELLCANQVAKGGDLTLRDVDRLLQEMINTSAHPSYQRDDGQMRSEDAAVSSFPHPFRELFVWCVLMNRVEMARLMLERADEIIATAIVACGIYHSLADKVSHLDSDLRSLYETNKNEFEVAAVGLLEECHTSDPDKAQRLVKCRYKMWGDTSCLSMGAAADCKSFLSTVCCQNVLNQMWKRGILSSWPKQLLALWCPPVIPLGVKFKQEMNAYEKLWTFYTAPSTKFMSFVIMYIIFVLFYSYVVLFRFREQIQISEMVLIAWMATWCLELLRSILTGSKSPKIYMRIIDWWKFSIFNSLDLAAASLCIIGVIMRFCPVHYLTTKKVYVVSLVVFYIRVLRDYSVSSYLGPKIIMIYKMFQQLVLYILILLIFLLAYGVSTFALRYPHRNFYGAVFRDIFYYPYWEIYGELYLDELEGRTDECSGDNATDALMSDGMPCPVYNWLVPAITAGYLLIVNILLLNLLIAIFNHVFEEVEVNSIQHWKHGMYFLVVEYMNKPSAAPPFIIFEHIYLFFKFIATRSCCKRILQEDDDSLSREKELLMIFEKESLKCIIRRQQSEQKTSADTFLYKILHKVDEISKMMDSERYWSRGDHAQSGDSEKKCADKSPQRTKSSKWPTLDRIQELKADEWSAYSERPESAFDSSVSRGMSPDIFSGNERTTNDVNLDRDGTKPFEREGSRETNESVETRAASRASDASQKLKLSAHRGSLSKGNLGDPKTLYKKLQKKLAKEDDYKSLDEEYTTEEEEKEHHGRTCRSKKRKDQKPYAEEKQLNNLSGGTDHSIEDRLTRLEQITERSLYNIETLLRGAVFQRGAYPPSTPLMNTFTTPGRESNIEGPPSLSSTWGGETDPRTTVPNRSSGIPYYTDYNKFDNDA